MIPEKKKKLKKLFMNKKIQKNFGLQSFFIPWGIN